MSKLKCVFQSAIQGRGRFVANTALATLFRTSLAIGAVVFSGTLRRKFQRASLSVASSFGGGLVKLHGALFYARKGYPDLWHLSYCYEPEVTALILDFVSRGGIFVDVGAHVGRYSVLSAVHGADRVLAVEANPVTFKALQRNLSLNDLEGRVIAFNVAAGDSEAVVDLSINTENDGGSSIFSRAGGTSVRVSMRPLDALLGESGVDPSRVVLVKIDVEGAEPLVLKGAKSLLDARVPILFEALDDQAFERVFSVLNPYGYKIRRVSGANYLAER